MPMLAVDGRGAISAQTNVLGIKTDGATRRTPRLIPLSACTVSGAENPVPWIG